MNLILTPEARNLCLLEVETLRTEAVVTEDSDGDGGEDTETVVRSSIRVSGTARPALMTIRVQDIESIAEAESTGVELEGYPPRRAVIHTREETILTTHSYDEVRAVLYGITHAPIINLVQN